LPPGLVSSLIDSRPFCGPGGTAAGFLISILQNEEYKSMVYYPDVASVDGETERFIIERYNIVKDTGLRQEAQEAYLDAQMVTKRLQSAVSAPKKDQPKLVDP
jgi:hypothetical protein